MVELHHVSIARLQFPHQRMKSFDIPKFRGSLAGQFPGYELIHNHLKNGKLRYGYPLIQFKVIDEVPTIIGIGEGIEILKSVFMEIQHIDIDGKRVTIWDKSAVLRDEELGQMEDFLHYRFKTPWMALKEESYDAFRVMDEADRQVFLRHLLHENLKTVSKGVHYWIPDIASIKVEGYFQMTERNFKNNRMLCFMGDFMMNFQIPDYLGIGKQVARGFCTVERMK